MNQVTVKNPQSYCNQDCKSKTVALLQAGAKGERNYSSYSFLAPALDGGEWSASRPCRSLPPGKGPPVPIVQEAGWAPEPVWTQRSQKKSFAYAADRTPIVQSALRHYTDWANPAPTRIVDFWIMTPYFFVCKRLSSFQRDTFPQSSGHYCR
jgi:hypothetical protein